MPAFCPLCAADDYTSAHVADDGRRFLLCQDKSHGSDGFVWEPSPPPGRSQRRDGLGAELEIWDKLLECVPSDGNIYPYGEVEDRFFAAYPADARLLLLRYGHRWRDQEHRSGQYSMSNYLASRLRELEKEGSLELSWGPATGEWAYNGVISHWSRGLPT